METAKPLTPSDVRKLLQSVDLKLDQMEFIGDCRVNTETLRTAMSYTPNLRATLERYAELAEEFGETYEAILRERT